MAAHISSLKISDRLDINSLALCQATRPGDGASSAIAAAPGRAAKCVRGRSRILRTAYFHDLENDILLAEEGGVLTVSQDGRSYLALRWKMTEEVVAVVQTAIRFGLSKLWQDGHPKGRQSSHISFSCTHEPASWVFALGLEACPPRLQKITFNKRFLPIFEASHLEWSSQKSGGHILVPPGSLAEVLGLLRARVTRSAASE
jgi:hypothetical protein